MNILMINGTHPETAHISSVRASRFAVELTRMGHHCVLICPPLPGREARTPEPITEHEWSAPHVIEAADPAPTARSSIGTLASLVRYGGRRAGFHRNVVARGRALASDFRPQIGWSTFGTLEGVAALRTLAHEQCFPWIFDDKDNPDIYVPRIMRMPLALRLRGYAALHANSVLHAEAAKRWLGRDAEVIYSGVDPCFFEPQLAPFPARRYVTLIGSLYHRETVAEIVGAVADYNDTNASPPLGIVHLGTQGGWLANDRGVPVEAPGYVPVTEMARICQHSIANLYVFLGRTFHHKLFELFACKRPTIAYGGELPESMAEARRLRACLAFPTTPAALTEALAAAESSVPDPQMPGLFFTWPEQAAMVERAMRRLVG